jgi:hypothetical protein
LVKSDGSVFAFDAEFILIGEYETQGAAVKAIPPPLTTKKEPRPKMVGGPPKEKSRPAISIARAATRNDAVAVDERNE